MLFIKDRTLPVSLSVGFEIKLDIAGNNLYENEEFTSKDSLHYVNIKDIKKAIKFARNSRYMADIVIIGGGEPLIWQKDKGFISLMKWLHRKFYVEVKTNGTIPLSPKMRKYIHNLKIYPRLSTYPNSYPRYIIDSFKVNKEFTFVVNSYIDLLNTYNYIRGNSLKEDSIYLVGEKVDYLKNTAIPFLEKNGVKATVVGENIK